VTGNWYKGGYSGSTGAVDMGVQGHCTSRTIFDNLADCTVLVVLTTNTDNSRYAR